MPKKITFDNNEFDGTIEYLYDASGTKLRKIVTDNTTSPTTVTTTHYLDGFQYIDDKLEFFPTAEGYVKATHTSSGGLGGGTTSYNYVFNYTDHPRLREEGNIRLRYALNEDNWMVILEEDHYYPFGLKHKGYNAENYVFISFGGGPVQLIPTNPNLLETYKYKHQGQERQDEFGLNWDSFKWRNYDYAIGRFMVIDPLASEYAYNSPYAFQENKIGLGRELEGLELVSERSKDGKSVTLTYNVKPVNNTAYANAPGTMLSNKDFNTLIQARADQTEATMSGQTTNGETVTVNVVFDDDATIIWEYNTTIDTEGTATGEDAAFKEMSPGKTTEIGNTQNNRTQVNVYSTLNGEGGKVNITPSGLEKSTTTGTHEDGHVVGGTHNDIPGNVMNTPNAGTNMTQEQRTQMLKLVEEQQPK